MLSLSSYSGVLFVYFAVNNVPFLAVPFFDRSEIWWLLFKYSALIAGIILLSRAALYCTFKAFRKGDTLKSIEIRPLEGVAIPTYIGLFVIALEISNHEKFEMIGLLVALFLLWRLIERIFYFNPLWLLFGYRFYEVKTVRSNTITLITKRQNLKGVIELDQLREINKYTYIEEDIHDSSGKM